MNIKEIIKQERIEAKLFKKEEASRARLIDAIKYSSTPNFNADLSYRSRLAHERSIIERLYNIILNDYYRVEIRNIIVEQNQLTGFKGASKTYRDFLTNF
jgi:hypothetical protein